MPRHVQVSAPITIRASRAGGRRRISMPVVVYGVEGDAQVGGRVTFAGPPRNLESSHDLVIDHDDDAVVGRSVLLTDSATGLDADYTVYRHQVGDDVLAAATDGTRAEASVHAMVFAEDADGVITDWELLNNSLVSTSAFGLAVREVAASRREYAMPKDPTTEDDVDTTTEDTARAAAEGAARGATESPDDKDDDDEAVGRDVEAARRWSPPRPAGRGRREPKLADIAARLARAQSSGSAYEVEAALADITYTAMGAAHTPQWLGELWDGTGYTRQFIPLIGQKPLTSMKITGWKWTTKPEVADYPGDKAAVPSNVPVIAPYEIAAARMAGAHDIDRIWFDFGDAEFYQSYLSAMTQSYQMKTDAKVGAALVAGATVLPASANLGAALVEAAVFVGKQAPATFALISTDLMLGALDVSNAAAPAWMTGALSAVLDSGLDSFKIKVDDSLADGTVLVGTKAAATFYELGGSPIRVEAENIPNGGRDAGVFGYYAIGIDNALGLASGSVAAIPPLEGGAGRSAKK